MFIDVGVCGDWFNFVLMGVVGVVKFVGLEVFVRMVIVLCLVRVV